MNTEIDPSISRDNHFRVLAAGLGFEIPMQRILSLFVERGDERIRAVDVAMATCAAPAYFPSAPIDGQLYADGGLFSVATPESARILGGMAHETMRGVNRRQLDRFLGKRSGGAT